MLNKELITEEEYNAKKQKIIDSSKSPHIEKQTD